MKENGITFNAYFSKASTLIDGGWRISFDLAEDSGILAAQVSALKGACLQVAVIPIEMEEDKFSV